MKIIGAFKKIFRIILMLFFRFDQWHTSPIENRQYACDVIKELRKEANRNTAMELGCGLGDIIGNLDYKEKYFLDISENALNAAKFLQLFSFKDTYNIYKVFDFLVDLLEEDISLDAIILVNWIHGYDSQILRLRICKLIENNLNAHGILVFDIIDNNSNYKYNHKVQDLIDESRFDIKIIDGYKFGRKLVYAKLK
jgi:hypothetical protein